MDPQELYKKAKEIFFVAIDLPEKDRYKYILSACQNNEDLLNEVKALLSEELSAEKIFQALEKEMAFHAVNSFLNKNSNFVGQKLKNRYFVLQQISKNVETFYLAEDLENSNQEVLIKIFPTALYLKEEFTEVNFFKEATILTKISHPQINPLFNFGITSSGDLFVVTANYPNTNLRNQLQNIKNDLPRAANIVSQLGEILGFLHNQNIYHTKLKPENIILLRENHSSEKVLLTNFGFTSLKMFSEELTQPVSPNDCEYLAPEQLINKHSKTSDIFALGVIIYEMLTGQKPYNLSTISPITLIDFVHLKEKQEILSPSLINPSIPLKISSIILHSLAYNPKFRPNQIKKFCNELATALQKEPILPSASTTETSELNVQKSASENSLSASSSNPPENSFSNVKQKFSLFKILLIGIPILSILLLLLKIILGNFK